MCTLYVSGAGENKKRWDLALLGCCDRCIKVDGKKEQNGSDWKEEQNGRGGCRW